MPCSYVHLGLEEHRRLHRLREAKVPVAQIAAALGRHQSTIHREIAWTWWHDAEAPKAVGCWPVLAQDLVGRRRYAWCKFERYPEPHAAVIDRLRAGRSPEQAALQLRIEPKAPQRLCC